MAESEVDVLIVGAGVSGIGMAHHLTERCPGKTYRILEARDQIGGTWDLFRYPGIRSDSDMYTFGYAFKPWVDGKVFADGPAIRNYLTETAEDAGMMPHLRFGRKVVSADWDSGTARWTVKVRAPDGNEEHTAKFLFLASGYYSYDRGYLPEFESLEDFKGDFIHPQEWNEDYDYTGKKVIIIGSGATAVTLLPAMAGRAAHVTMLQRSPTYIAARPTVDRTANFLRRVLPAKWAYGITRYKNIFQTILIFQMAQRFPEFVKKAVMKEAQKALGPDIDVEQHFAPAYKPWDQRFCAAPDGDFFAPIRDGQASVVTAQIDRFTETGIQLKTGEHLEADLVIPATGLNLQLMGGILTRVDGKMVNVPDHVVYRGMMVSDIPNLAMAFGYTNASWTLKIDLTCERVCRTINHLDKVGADFAVPIADPDMPREPLKLLDSGYFQRARDQLPMQGPKTPWQVHMNYIADMMAIRFGKIDDGAMQFITARDHVSETRLPEAAE
ncbi:flavin-containing monooxygenase [Hyphobacterium sp.]|uniref:flavin-containing monooxygenase n=1 Tax=Hyphobacterium sp. TaxID=2004662 RepID=UPI003BAC4AED